MNDRRLSAKNKKTDGIGADGLLYSGFLIQASDFPQYVQNADGPSIVWPQDLQDRLGPAMSCSSVLHFLQ